MKGKPALDSATVSTGEVSSGDAEGPRFVYAVGALDRAVRRRLGVVLGSFSLTLPEYTALSLLRRRGGYSNAELAKGALVSPQAMNEVIKSLEERRILERTPSTSHGSVLNTFLTEAGRELLNRCDIEVDAMERAMLDGISADDAKETISLLMRCVRNLRDNPAGEPPR